MKIPRVTLAFVLSYSLGVAPAAAQVQSIRLAAPFTPAAGGAAAVTGILAQTSTPALLGAAAAPAFAPALSAPGLLPAPGLFAAPVADAAAAFTPTASAAVSAPAVAAANAAAAPSAPIAYTAPAAASAAASAAPAEGTPTARKLRALANGVAGLVRVVMSRGASQENVRRGGEEIVARMQGGRLAAGQDASDAVLALDTDQKRTPGGALLPEEENNIRVFKIAAPSTVFIKNLQVEHNYYGDEAVVPHGLGSGYIWDKEGHIVTNYHVVDGGDGFEVTLKDGTKLPAKFVGGDPNLDIAVIKISGSANELTPVQLGDSDQLQVGQRAIAIGNPFGLSHTMTTGVVSAVRELPTDEHGGKRKMIQTDAAVNPGNSGGPLLDSGARLIGMNTMIMSRSGSSAGVGFAVPVNAIKQVVPKLIKRGGIVDDRPALGVGILSGEEKAGLGVEGPGVVVAGVVRGSPADDAGLKGLQRLGGGRIGLGDVIVGVNGQQAATPEELSEVLAQHRPGDSVTLQVVRQGRIATVRIKLTSLHQSGIAALAHSNGAHIVGLKPGARKPARRRR